MPETDSPRSAPLAMPEYPVRCYAPGCRELAEFKIAAAWSDGITRELKTYSLCCPGHLAGSYREACERHARCRVAPGELLEKPGIYEWYRGRRDAELRRRRDLEGGG